MESLTLPTTSSAVSKTNSYAGKHNSRVAAHIVRNNNVQSLPQCALCGSNHYLMKCGSFLSKTPQQRKEFVSTRRLCFNCLGPHTTNKCSSLKRCLKCGKRHHTSLRAPLDGQSNLNLTVTSNKDKINPSNNLSSDQSSSI